VAALQSRGHEARLISQLQANAAFARVGLRLNPTLAASGAVTWTASTSDGGVNVSLYKKPIRKTLEIDYYAVGAGGPAQGYFVVSNLLVQWAVTPTQLGLVKASLASLRQIARSRGIERALPAS
jgi:hypothetical protein